MDDTGRLSPFVVKARLAWLDERLSPFVVIARLGKNWLIMAQGESRVHHPASLTTNIPAPFPPL